MARQLLLFLLHPCLSLHPSIPVHSDMVMHPGVDKDSPWKGAGGCLEVGSHQVEACCTPHAHHTAYIFTTTSFWATTHIALHPSLSVTTSPSSVPTLNCFTCALPHRRPKLAITILNLDPSATFPLRSPLWLGPHLKMDFCFHTIRRQNYM